jgi:hypothetical protein
VGCAIFPDCPIKSGNDSERTLTLVLSPQGRGNPEAVQEISLLPGDMGVDLKQTRNLFIIL